MSFNVGDQVIYTGTLSSMQAIAGKVGTVTGEHYDINNTLRIHVMFAGIPGNGTPYWSIHHAYLQLHTSAEVDACGGPSRSSGTLQDCHPFSAFVAAGAGGWNTQIIGTMDLTDLSFLPNVAKYKWSFGQPDAFELMPLKRPPATDHFPHTCPRCGAAAYVGIKDVDCSRAGCHS